MRPGVKALGGKGLHQTVERGDCRGIGDSVDALRAKVPLEGAKHRCHLLVEFRMVRKTIAVFPESSLETCHLLAAAARLEDRPGEERLMRSSIGAAPSSVNVASTCIQ